MRYMMLLFVSTMCIMFLVAYSKADAFTNDATLTMTFLVGGNGEYKEATIVTSTDINSCMVAQTELNHYYKIRARCTIAGGGNAERYGILYHVKGSRGSGGIERALQKDSGINPSGCDNDGYCWN